MELGCFLTMDSRDTNIEYCRINMFSLSKWSVNRLDLEPKSQ